MAIYIAVHFYDTMKFYEYEHVNFHILITQDTIPSTCVLIDNLQHI